MTRPRLRTRVMNRMWLTAGLASGVAYPCLSILNGYPGYACTLQTTLENRGQGTVRLDRLEYEVPAGLNILGPEYAEQLILAPGQRKQQDFTVLVEEDAKQGGTHSFHIWQVFTPQD